MFTRAYGHKQGTFLYEQDRLQSCGLPIARIRPAAPLTLGQTLKWARGIPRAARQAQGFKHINDFAWHVKLLRAKRAELRKQQPDPLRRVIMDTLERIMLDRADLRKAARRAAKANCHPDFPVWWNGSEPHLYAGLRVTRWRYFPKRNVAVPAKWVLARLGGGAANVAVRVKKEILRLERETRERQKEAKRQAERQRARQEAQKRFLAPSPDVPDTLGWRGWRWDGRTLVSPVQRTPWHEPSLHAEWWSDSAAVRGQAGIHARLVPTDWRRADPRLTEIGHCDVHGIVERFGHYVLGTEGWRAQWVVIRELMAPDSKTALALMGRYPEVKIHVRELEETP